MEKCELEYRDAKSNKFWRIELEGNAHTVTYGRIGATGSSKTQSFDSAEAARKSYDNLIGQKRAKGYVNAVAGGSAAGGDDGKIPFEAFPCTTGGNHEHAQNFMGLRVVAYKPGKKVDPNKNALYFGTEYGAGDIDEILGEFLASDAAPLTRALVIGPWAEEMYDNTSAGMVERLVTNKNRLPNLVGLFLGDIILEEFEISWIHQSDVGPLLKAFPKLQLLRVRGGQTLEINHAHHDGLRALAIEAGGLGSDVLKSILSGNLPNLEYLELWLGTEEYGGTCTVEDLQPLLKGTKFPKLRYLGLRNCQFADDVASVVVNAPVVQRIEVLDMSLGTLSDAGGQALLSLPTGGSLKRLDLHYNFLSRGMAEKLKALPLAVDVSDTQDEDDGEFRFVAVSE